VHVYKNVCNIFRVQKVLVVYICVYTIRVSRVDETVSLTCQGRVTYG